MVQENAILQVLTAQTRSIGDAKVLRVLPSVERRTVGPFVFVDVMGSHNASHPPRPLHDVPPHPHIGIATVTYLFSGALFHRDSIGSAQRIEAGDVNWMSSGRGIVHGESILPSEGAAARPVFGVQSWVALPVGREDQEPTFEHVPSSQLPVIARERVEVRLVAGSGFGQESPVRVASPLVAAAVVADGGGRLVLPSDHDERAIILLEGSVLLDGQRFEAGTMIVLREGTEPELVAQGNARAFLIGGPALLEKRYLDWNFCSTRKERIAEAKDLYRRGLLGRIPELGENLPLPEDVR